MNTIGQYVIYNSNNQPVSTKTTLVAAKDKVRSLGKGARYEMTAVKKA
jgi:hypothetical protein